jgi:hypothetical protein
VARTGRLVAEGAVGSLWAAAPESSATRSVSWLDVAGESRLPVWGRDELATGEMWNSNSMIAWTLARSGIDTESI